MIHRRLGVLSLLLPLVLSGHALAKGTGPDATVIITGGRLARPIIVRGPAADPLGMGTLMLITCRDPHTCGSSMPLPHRGPAYTLTRPGWDHVRYYPSAQGMQGAIFYIGLLQPGTSSVYDGKWFPVSPAGDRALKRILVAQGMRVGGGR